MGINFEHFKHKNLEESQLFNFPLHLKCAKDVPIVFLIVCSWVKIRKIEKFPTPIEPDLFMAITYLVNEG